MNNFKSYVINSLILLRGSTLYKKKKSITIYLNKKSSIGTIMPSTLRTCMRMSLSTHILTCQLARHSKPNTVDRFPVISSDIFVWHRRYQSTYEPLPFTETWK